MIVLSPCIEPFLCIALKWALSTLSVTWLPDFFFARNGQAIFSRKTVSQILDIVFNSAIQERRVHVLNQAPRTSLSLIFRALITLPLTIVIAVTHLCQHGNSCSQQLFHVLRPSLLLIVLKPSTNSLFKERQASMTSTILSYGDLIMPISRIQL